MLPPWIIEEVEKARREREERKRPRVELPLPAPRYEPPPSPAPERVIRIEARRLLSRRERVRLVHEIAGRYGEEVLLAA